MEPQITLDSQSNLGKEKQSWRNYKSWFQTMLQSYSNENSMELTQNSQINGTKWKPQK